MIFTRTSRALIALLSGMRALLPSSVYRSLRALKGSLRCQLPVGHPARRQHPGPGLKRQDIQHLLRLL